MSRIATCQCGQLKATCSGDPVRISVCHCLDCQRRTGSVFSSQARWQRDSVTVEGTFKTWERVADSGNRLTFNFCPTCGSTVFYSIETAPDIVAIPLGAFADPEFPAPTFSVFEDRMHSWTAVLGEHVERSSRG